MKIKRKIIQIDEEKCNGCGQCVPSCAEGAIQLVDGKARLAAEKYCDGLGACLGECPVGALKVIEREADDFDEHAVEEHLQAMWAAEKKEQATLPCGCPSTQVQAFTAHPAPKKTPAESVRSASALTHWPVQIKLVPPTAPFLKGADLLVAADCTPVAYPNFHQDFLQGKVVLLGCPKLDDAQAYVQKFAEIFNTAQIKSLTVVTMEVPCCGALPLIVKRGLEQSGKNIPLQHVVVSTRGEILQKKVA